MIGLAFGGVRSVRRGVGSDVASAREYRPGDDVGWMDWAASAKLSAEGADVRQMIVAGPRPRVVTDAGELPAEGDEATDAWAAVLERILQAWV